MTAGQKRIMLRDAAWCAEMSLYAFSERILIAVSDPHVSERLRAELLIICERLHRARKQDEVPDESELRV